MLTELAAANLSACSSCGWRGWTGDGRCPACDVAPETDRIYQQLVEHEPRNVRVGRFVTQRRGAAPGRNDPCTCGSGRKSKRCCW